MQLAAVFYDSGCVCGVEGAKNRIGFMIIETPSELFVQQERHLVTEKEVIGASFSLEPATSPEETI